MDTKKMRAFAPLLPPPGNEVVCDCLDEIERLRAEARGADALREKLAGIEQLRLAEEGAKEAFGHVVQQKRDLEKECKRLRGLLDGAYETIRRQAHNAALTERGD